jgi:hypothetical protein
LKYSSITAVTGLIDDGMSLVMTFSNAEAAAPLSSSCLSTNTIFTLTKSGVGVTVAEGVKVDVLLGVKEGVEVTVKEGVSVGVLLGMMVGEGAADGVNDFVAVGTLVNVDVDVNAGVFVDVMDGAKVGVLEVATVEILPGVFEAGRVAVGSGAFVAAARVDLGDASGIWVFKKGIDGRLDFGSRENAASKIPAAAKAPIIEKALCARNVFCLRIM